MRAPRADLILLNGNVRTMSDRLPTAQAVASAGESIVAVGSNDEVRELADEATRVVDLKGRLVLPGFTDSHTHILGYGISLEQVDLREAKSLAEAVTRVKSRVGKLKPGEWVTGGRWDKNIWPEGRFPRKEDLDPISPDNPVILSSKDGHGSWVNSLALKLAGITKDTPNPPGGEIERNPATGEPTGILKETAARLVRNIVGQPTDERAEAALKNAFEVANRRGLVGVHVMEGPQTLRAAQSLRQKGQLNVRVHMLIAKDSFQHAVEVGVKTGFGDSWISLGSVKVIADGALGVQTAFMLDPYENNPGHYGIMVTSKEELTELVVAAGKAGISSATHAIGDAACRNALDAIEAARKAGYGLQLRHRLEHVQLIQPEDRRRMAQMGVIASMQPIHLTADRDIADRHWGSRCVGKGYLYRTMIDSGVHMAFGSDVPVETLDPLQGIYAAIARKRAEEPDRPAWYPEERISVYEAVHGYTRGAAYASLEENLKGSIEVGKLADMVVLSKDIFDSPVEEILQTRVEYTIVGGKVVYEAD